MFKTLIDQFTTDEDNSLRSLIDDFTTAEAGLQQTSNPSGSVSTGGLGEPKFNIDGTAFTGPWGRPQRGRYLNNPTHKVTSMPTVPASCPDGPALRSTALITYANWLLANGNGTSYVQQTLWPSIKLDLDYVQNNWNQSTYVFLKSQIYALIPDIRRWAVSTFGRKSIPLHSSLPLFSIVLSVRARHSPRRLDNLRLPMTTRHRQTTFSASCK